MTPETDRHRNLSGLVIRGLGWTAGSQLALKILGLVTSVLVARLLGPRDVGLAAEALVFGTLALVVVDFGFGAAVVQRERLTEQDRSTAFWAGLALGLGVTLVGVGLSWPIAELYGEPRVQPLIAAVSVTFAITAPGIVQGALLTRELHFRSLELRSMAATAISSATAISLAFAGFGPWAIIAQTIMMALTSTALLWRASPWRPRWTFSTASLRSMIRFAGPIFGARTLDWGTMTLDNFLIGRFVGAAPLGAYALAYSVIVSPVKSFVSPVMRVFFPAFSLIRDPERVAVSWLRIVRLIAFIVAPAMLGLIVVAPDLVEVVFGARWREAIPVIQILAPVGLIQSLSGANFTVLESLARTRIMFRFTVALSVVTVLAFLAGLPWGIEGVATGLLVATLIMHPIFASLTAKEVGLTMRGWIQSFAGVLQASLLMVGVVFVLREALLGTELAVAPRLILLILAGAASYLPLIAWRAPLVRSELLDLRDRRRQS